MKKDRLNKEIDILSNEKNHIWNIFLLSITGTAALILNHDTFLRLLLLFVSLIINIVLILIYFKKNDQLENLLNKIEKE